MGAITGKWQEALAPEFRKPYYRKLYETVRREYASRIVYPPSEDLLMCLRYVHQRKWYVRSMSLSGHVNDGAFSRRNASAAELGMAFVYSSSSCRLNSGTYLAQASGWLSV